MRIVVIEDDPSLNAFLQKEFVAQQVAVYLRSYGTPLVDINLWRGEGVELFRYLREACNKLGSRDQ